ncbi:MAG TPA: ribonuclease Z, partial [Salinivirgaceae bacterium]|nr:ribonuclease Z [Salinivirgaceae bacterium]
MNFRLTILGSGSALPTTLRNTTAHVLNVHERFFLIDCGEGCQLQMRKNNIPFNRIDSIFISHLHGDHYFGIFGFLSTLYLMGRIHPLHIYADPKIENILKTVLQYETIDWTFPIIIHPLNFEMPEVILNDRSLKVTSFPLRHSLPTCGFLFEEQPRDRKIDKSSHERLHFTVKEINTLKLGDDIERDGTIIKNRDVTIDPVAPRKYAFVTDTLMCSSLSEIIRDVDILYHEATYLHNELALARQTCHSTALQAAQLAKKA